MGFYHERTPEGLKRREFHKDQFQKRQPKPTDTVFFKLEQQLDPKFLNVDPLKDSYKKGIVQKSELIKAIRSQHTALLVIDMQYLDAARGYGVFADTDKSAIPVKAQEYYFSTLENVVIPNIRKLQGCFRSCELEIIHTRIQALTQDGRDRSLAHKRLDLLATPGSKEAEFLEEVAPAGDEIVINKTASGVFSSTNLYFILNNLKIDALFVTGVYTNECVSTTVRDASDLGFLVTLIDDGCTTVTPELHGSTITTLRDRYARIITTDMAICEIQKSFRKSPKLRKAAMEIT